jgi:hypothetical protein
LVKFVIRFSKGKAFVFFIREKWSQRIHIYRFFYSTLPDYYSHFLTHYSTIFWFRVTMVAMLIPIRMFFNAYFYPLLTEYFMIGAPIFIVLNAFCTFVYLCVLIPGFWEIFRREGDIYIFLSLQMIYIEAAGMMPTAFYYMPFTGGDLLSISRAYDFISTLGFMSNVPRFNPNLHNQSYEDLLNDEEDAQSIDALPYSALKPVPNPLAPGQLYKIAVTRSHLLYGFENRRYVEYFFRRHMKNFSPRWRRRYSFIQTFWTNNEQALEDMLPVSRSMVWHSGRTPFFRHDRRLGYHDKKLGPIWAKRSYYRARRTRVVGGRYLHMANDYKHKNVPSYMLDLSLIPNGSTRVIETRRFEKLVEAYMRSYVADTNKHLISTRIRTFFDLPALKSVRDPSEFYIYLRGQRKLDSIHFSATVIRNDFFSRESHPGRQTFHYLFPSHSQYKTDSRLRLIEKWSAIF